MDIYSNSKILSYIEQQKGPKLTELKYLLTHTKRESSNNDDDNKACCYKICCHSS